MVRVGGPGRRMLDFFLLSIGGVCWACWLLLPRRPMGVRRLSRDFL